MRDVKFFEILYAKLFGSEVFDEVRVSPEDLRRLQRWELFTQDPPVNPEIVPYARRFIGNLRSEDGQRTVFVSVSYNVVEGTVRATTPDARPGEVEEFFISPKVPLLLSRFDRDDVV